MTGTIVLTPDQLAQIVVDVCKANNLDADGLALYQGDQLVGYDRAVIVLREVPRLEVPQRRNGIDAEELHRILNPPVPHDG